MKLDDPGFRRLPWLTWSLSAAILFVSVFAFFNLDEAVVRFGLVPAQVWRHGGFTLLSSFFLHAGLWHLLGNLYFLPLFGGSVEDYLGRSKYLLLILLALLGADVLAVVLQPHSVVPSIGASGGISGVIAFYALEFPRDRLGFFLRWTWVSLPAWGAFAIWVLIQIFEAWEQLAGVGEVSGLAHLGGAVVGFLWWLGCGDTLTLGSKKVRKA